MNSPSYVCENIYYCHLNHIISVLPEAINRLQEKDRTRYIELMQSSEVEKRYFVRIMVVGKESVGKTSLVRRLLMKNIDDVVSTDGVDIVVDQCKINIEDGSWLIDGKRICKQFKMISFVNFIIFFNDVNA